MLIRFRKNLGWPAPSPKFSLPHCLNRRFGPFRIASRGLFVLNAEPDLSGKRFGSHWPFAAAVGIGFAGLAWIARVGVGGASAESPVAVERVPQGNLRAIGTALFGPFVLPFEIASLLLLAAIIGAVVLARRRAA